MGNGNDNDISKWTKWVKLAVGILTVFTLVGGVVWGMTTTFAKKEYVDAQFSLAQRETVKTFDQVQKQFERFGKQQDIKFYQRELRDLNSQHISIEKQLGTQPNNPVLQDERQRIIDSKKLMQQELDILMR